MDIDKTIEAGRSLETAANASKLIDRYEALDDFDKNYIDKIDLIREQSREDNKIFQIIIAALLLVSVSAVAILWRKLWRRQ